MTALRVSLLGRFATESDGASVEIRARASQSLFAYLALNRDASHRRELLAGMFWPDSDGANARNNLRHALWQIRSALGQDVFAADKVTVTVDPELEWWVDADQIVGVASATIHDLQQAAAHYQGDLLPGFYEDWVILDRERLRSAFGQLMERLLDGLVSEKRWPEVSDWAERWIALGHVPEPAFRALMVAHAARGDQAGAAAVYRRCVDTLGRELGVEPSGQTQLLHEQLMAGELPHATEPAQERYELGPEIGRGGMGEVYRALDTWLEREVAVKVLSSQVLGPEGRERLLAEAQAAARLNHPNVVSVYDVGEREGQPFIVMELVEGKTLHDHPPESLGERLAIALEICAALEHAHVQGVIHRDLKPENVMLAPDGTARLMDFGLASRRVEAPGAPEGGTAGTVYYLAPEMLQGEPASVQSDLYSLGVLLYELLSGELPFGGDDPLTVIAGHLEAEPKPPSELNLEIRPALEALILRLLSKQPGDRPLSAAAVAEVLEAVVPEEVQLGEPAPGEPPFKGLEYYDVDDADIFFGREALVERLLERLQGERFLAVIVGASGSGKSSIARAGLVPALHEHDSQWVFRLMTPTEQPLSALSEALVPSKPSERETAPSVEELASDSTTLHQAAGWLVETEGAEKLLLVVDQLEEVFTLCDDEAERAAFIDNLLTAADPEQAGPTVLVITLRADFYPHCAKYPALREALARNQEYIGPMDTSELRRAIEEPAARSGWKFQSGLVDLMLRDVRGEPGALPLLSHALLETWKRRSRRTMTLRGYAQAGGVRRAIARTAEHVCGQLSDKQLDIARNIFLRLTELGEGTEDTRRRVTYTELIPEPGRNGTTEEVLATLAESRLVTLSKEHIEVAHEALIREWPRLREWLDEDREGLRIHRHLTEAAQAWAALERDPGELYRGGRLAQAMEWSDEQRPELNPLESEFLDASRAMAEQREAEREAQVKRLRRRAIYLAGALVAAVAMAIAAASFGRQASESASQAQAANTEVVAEANFRATAEAASMAARDEAQHQQSIAEQEARAALEAYSLSLSANADEALKDLDTATALMLAMTANEIEDPPLNSQRILLEAAHAPGARRHFEVSELFEDVSGTAQSIDIHPSQQIALLGFNDGTVILWNVQSSEEIHRLIGHTAKVNDVEFSPDGSTALSASDDWQVVYWDLDSGEEIHRLTGHNGWVLAADFSPDGSTAITGGWTGDTIAGPGEVILWDLRSGQEVRRFEGPVNGVADIAFSPDGTMVLAVSGWLTYEGIELIYEFHCWDAETGNVIRRIENEIHDLNRIVTRPDGTALSSSADSNLYLWDLQTGEKTLFIEGDGSWLTDLSISENGRWAVSGSEAHSTLFFWDLLSQQLISQFDVKAGPNIDVAVSPDGRWALSSSTDGSLVLWDLVNASEIRRFEGHTAFGIAGLRFMPDGSAFVSGSGRIGPGFPIEDDNSLRLWDLETGEQIQQFDGHTDGVISVAVSPDGKRLLSGGLDHSIRLWDIDSGEEIRLCEGHDSWVLEVIFLLDGRRGVSSDIDGRVLLWDLDSCEILREHAQHDWGGVWTLSITPDGSKLLEAGNDSHVFVWDLESGELLLRFEEHWEDGVQVSGSAISPDGRFALTVGVDSIIIQWDLESGQEIQRLRGNTGHTQNRVSISPDGRRALLTGGEGALILWDLEAGTVLYSYDAPDMGYTFESALSPDGMTGLFTVGYSIISWDLNVPNLGELRDWIAENRYVRELSCEERASYGIRPPCDGEGTELIEGD